MQVEYVEVVDAEGLQAIAAVERSIVIAIAARVWKTRLIDNLILPNRESESLP
jgi:pantothenate synthetase